MTPWLGSVKQTWKTQSLSAVTSSEDADGVIMNTRASFASAATATDAPVVVGPTRACMPQSSRALNAFTEVSGSATSSSALTSKV